MKAYRRLLIWLGPSAKVRTRGRERSVIATQATDEEKRVLWPRLLEVYPAWEAYTHRTDRSFRAFFLEPAELVRPPT